MQRRLLVVVLFASGCKPAPPVQPAWDPAPREAPPPTAQVEDPPPPRSAQAEAMHAWMLQLADVRDAAVTGDVEAVRTGARRWLETIEDDVDPAWQDQVVDVRREATTLAGAKALPEAAETIARLAGSCGRCHESQGVADRVRERLPPDADPPQGQDAAAVMRQHRWASARMWEGLVGPSQTRWTRGTTMFVILPDCPDPEAGQDDGRCQRARRLARRAHVVEAPEGRVSLYGRLLSTCADCHTAGPG